MITNKIDYKVYSNKPFAIWANSRIINERLSANSYNRDYLDFAKAKNTFNFKKVSDIAKVTAMIGWKGLTTDDYVDEDGVYLLRTVDIKDNYIDLENAVMAKREKVYEQLQIILKQGDIIFSKDGTLGITAIVPRHQNKEMCVGSTLARIRLNSNLDNYYVCAAFMSKIVQAQIGYFTSGIAQPHITQEYINKLEIPIPSPEIQKYIGDKVRKAEELREEAKTLQKEIDILLEVDMLLKEETDKVYNIYDSKINWTNEINIEDRIDPNFYQKKYISTIEKLGNNKVRLEKYVRITKIRYQTGNINKYIEISSINNSFGTIDEVKELRPEEIPTSAKYQVKEGDILVSLVRPTRKAISIVTKEYDNAICTGGFAVLQSKGKVPVEFLTAVLRTNFVGIQFERYCAGSTYPTINEDDVVKVFIPMYSENQINKITENYRRIIDNIYTSKKLIEEAKQDVEDLIEGNFDMSKVKATS